MRFREQLATLASRLRQELAFYRALHAHPQTPPLAKALLWLALGYLVMPFDLIPDFIPVIGQLDELVIVPLLLHLAMKVTPLAVQQACRSQVSPAASQK
ncbi:Protein of unknown function [Methylophilus rhizosphaerae]|uniref:DUF1232 domain-containing protein n=1 Tax=Methylophilus rhizosphaerae TaxID=492660 RepID=A0A1G9EZD5_9PROT|nr:DUF1232 domain-containing protein [Methylophilus rhizosphaerae]SDK81547.1 Protein of unknown function [Methylophilus rhizosphaerae]